MIKTLKNSLPLLLTASLAACGLAEPTDPYETNPDKINPELISSLPVNKGTLKTTDSTISLKLNEVIDIATLVALNSVAITSTDGKTIEGSWSFKSETKELIFTLTDRASIPAGQQFQIKINGEITDAAKNPLITTLSFSTPGLFDINISAKGLLAGESVSVIQGDKSVTIDANDKTFTLDANLADKAAFSLSISQQAAESFCSLSITAGTISNNNALVNVKCHNVKPVYSAAANWNQYHKVNDTTWIHGGEFRSISFASLNSCDAIYAKDSLNSFDWACSVDDNGQVKFTSTGLKSGSGLSQLIDFDNVKWKEIQLDVLGSIDDRSVDKSSKGTWWNNPVVAITSATPTSLPQSDTIYLIKDNLTITKKRQINKSGIALLVKPGLDFIPYSDDAAIAIGNTAQGTWIEGSVDASQSHIGIKINSASFAMINNAVVKNAETNGIEISDTLFTKILNTQSTQNNGVGIYINDNIEGGASLIQNTLSANNGLSGIILTGHDTTLSDIISSNNAKHGIKISGNGNKLSDVYVNNNREDGLALIGANNNIITATTITSNGNSGISFSLSAGGENAKNNVINNVTIANNNGSGIKLGTEEGFSNSFNNILDTYNAASVCPAATCSNSNITTVTLSDTAVSNLFIGAVESDSQLTAYSLSTGQHFNVATTKNTFDNKYRAWGNINAISAEAGSGSCNHLDEVDDTNNRCILFDWSLSNTDETYALNQLTADNTVSQHTFLDAANPVSYLNNAVEIINDKIGNNNGLCEENETCLFTPNKGSYQGHSNMDSLENTNDLNASLLQYKENGR